VLSIGAAVSMRAAQVRSLRPLPLATIRCTRKREKKPEGIALDGEELGQTTAAPGSVGASEAVGKRMGSTLAITGRGPERELSRGRRVSVDPRKTRLRQETFFVGSCLSALPSRALEAAASLGERGLPKRRTLHHRFAGTGSGVHSLPRVAPLRIATLNSEESNTYGVAWNGEL